MRWMASEVGVRGGWLEMAWLVVGYDRMGFLIAGVHCCGWDVIVMGNFVWMVWNGWCGMDGVEWMGDLMKRRRGNDGWIVCGVVWGTSRDVRD